MRDWEGIVSSGQWSQATRTMLLIVAVFVVAVIAVAVAIELFVL